MGNSAAWAGQGGFPPGLALPNIFSFVFTLYLLWDISEINPVPVQLGLGSKSYPETTNKSPANSSCHS